MICLHHYIGSSHVYIGRKMSKRWPQYNNSWEIHAFRMLSMSITAWYRWRSSSLAHCPCWTRQRPLQTRCGTLCYHRRRRDGNWLHCSENHTWRYAVGLTHSGTHSWLSKWSIVYCLLFTSPMLKCISCNVQLHPHMLPCTFQTLGTMHMQGEDMHFFRVHPQEESLLTSHTTTSSAG